MSIITLRSQVKPSLLYIHPHKAASDTAGKDDDPQSESESIRLSSIRSKSGSFLPEKNAGESDDSFTNLANRGEDEQSASFISLKPDQPAYFCDWLPKLFGVDEESIPLTDESSSSEELFGEEEEEEDGKPKAKPKYGRRARAKPQLKRGSGEEFECICEIDQSFERHYIPHFGGGVRTDKEWRVPHFASFWEERNERLVAKEDGDLLKMVDIRPAYEEPEEEQAKPKGPRKKRELMYNDPKKYARQYVLERLRPLSCRELRRHRMAFCEAILLEMEEDGYIESASFLKSLLIQEYHLDQSRDPCPTLRKSRSTILKVMKLLMAAERRGRKQEYGMQSFILLKTGRYFSLSEETWWWLAVRMFEKAVEVASNYLMDGGKSESMARYIYGMFLLDQAEMVHAAQKQLTRARELSQGRDWNAKMIMEDATEPIHKECCNHLCRALIETSRQLRKEGKSDEALHFIHQSYKLCEEAQISRDDILLETLFELGMTYQEIGELEWAKLAFKKYVAKAKLVKSTRNICDGHLELAICFRMEGDANLCHHHLKSYLSRATQNGDPLLIAFGNRYLGELLLNHSSPYEADEYFTRSFEGFYALYNKASAKPFDQWLPEDFALADDVELVRVLKGLALGETRSKYICSLILQSGDLKNQHDAIRLLRWKNSNIIEIGKSAETVVSPLSSVKSIRDLLSIDRASRVTQSSHGSTRRSRVASFHSHLTTRSSRIAAHFAQPVAAQGGTQTPTTISTTSKASQSRY
ncbi:UNVERIFIED_CONTAM: hypothetical protein PYX00_010591 [Menopon gallinae]|uniref:Tetratricopeptide repeat protein 29 n=1 Tax=Menopon gallinae TaxID=328185 RepID=A0AAW2HG27_9NEOP